METRSARELRVIRATVVEGMGQREHSLTDRHLGQYSIDQMRRGIPAKRSFACIAACSTKRGVGCPRRAALARNPFQLLANDPVEERLLRLMAFIVGHAVPFRDRRGGALKKNFIRLVKVQVSQFRELVH